MFGKGLQIKKYQTLSFLSVVSKVFEKFMNNRIVDHLEKFDLFCLQYGFKSSRLTVDLLIVVSDFQRVWGHSSCSA